MKKLTISVLAGLLALAGLLTLIVGIARTQAAERDVVINEVAWMGTGASAYDEWIELYNNTDSDIALTNWTLKATDSAPNLTLAGTIPAKGYFLLERTDDSTVSDIAADLIYSGSLGNGGEDLELRDGDNNLIDSVDCETAGDWYVGDNSTKQTMERKVSTASGTEASNWANNDGITVNGLDANGDPLKATPKAQNSALVGVDGSGTATISPIYGEVEIAGTWTIAYTATQDISGGTITIDIPTGWTTPTTAFDTPGYTIRTPGTGMDESDLGILTVSDQTITIPIIDMTPGDDFIVTYGEIGGAATPSIGGEATFLVKSAGEGGTLTPISESPTVYARERIKINEVLYDPVGSNKGNQWVELYNAQTTSVDITNWVLNDEDATIPITLPSLTIPAGAFVVIYIDKEGTDDTDFSDNAAHIYSGTETTMLLATTEDEVSLRNGSVLVDFMAYCGDGDYAGEDDDEAVEADIWTDDDFVDTSSLGLDMEEGDSLILSPDGDDNNLSSDWEKDSTPTPGYSNLTIALPSAPTNLTAQAGDSLVLLSWNASTPGDNPLAGYNLYRGLSSGEYGAEPINGTTPISEISYQDTDVTNDTTYYYVVRAVDTKGQESNNSNEASATPVSARIVISEIMYNPEGSEPENEWIELYNREDGARNLSGWQFTDGEGTFIFPTGTIIASHGYLTLGYSSSAAGGNVDLVYGGASAGTIALANDADDVIIKNALGIIVDEVHYTSAWGGKDGYSLERKDLLGPSDDKSNWGESLTRGGTPKGTANTDTIPPTIDHTPITQAIVGRDICIHAEIKDNQPWYTADARLYYRKTGTESYAEQQMTGIYDDYTGIIPAGEVTLAGVDYYLAATDDYNNTATHPQVDPIGSPHHVEVITGVSVPRVVINEIMYDPSGTEPDLEWFELYNAGASPVDLSGWTITDLEGTYTFPGELSYPEKKGKRHKKKIILRPGRYLVLGYSREAARRVDFVYGESAPNIRLSNVFAGVSDEIILKDKKGLIIDEADYAANWGASNGKGPNNNTLERLDPLAGSSDPENWLYSMVKDGTPGEKNSSHILRNISASPTLINPDKEETSTITYTLTRPARVTVTIYAPRKTGRGGKGYYKGHPKHQGKCPKGIPRSIWDWHRRYLGKRPVRTLLFFQKQQPGTHSVVWDGKDYRGRPVYDVCTFVVKAAAREKPPKGPGFHKSRLPLPWEICVSDCNDAVLMVENPKISTTSFTPGGYGVVTFMYTLTKPALVDFHVWLSKPGGAEDILIRHLFTTQPRGGNKELNEEVEEFWDGRDDNGVPVPIAEYSGVILPEDIYGNVIISLTPFNIRDVDTSPRSSFDPANNETQTILYNLPADTTVTIQISDPDTGTVVRTLVDNKAQAAGSHSASWDGMNDSGVIVPDSKYTITITATTTNQSHQVFRESCVWSF